MSTLGSTSLNLFLVARIEEDEVAARCARWRDGENYSVYSYLYGADGAHIARHEPPRVLADCEAKRRLITLAEEANQVDYNLTVEMGDRRPASYRNGRVGDRILHALASAYSNHPDFRDEWTP